LKAGNREQGTGGRYGADAVQSDDEIADWYRWTCEWLEQDGVVQYEISNFAREGHASRHNLKYWQRKPYVGFGLDAHSMLRDGVGGVRWANADQLETYLAEYTEPAMANRELQVFRTPEADVERVGKQKAFEEAMFLGLRMNDGVNLDALRADFGTDLMQEAMDSLADIEEAGHVVLTGSWLKLTARGRMASNEVFSRLLVVASA